MTIKNQTTREPADFNIDLEEGKEAERQFKKVSGLKLTHWTKNNSFDFANFAADGSITSIELKSDKYKNSPNFFFERYSSIEAMSPGGPWQSNLHHVDLYIYWFRFSADARFYIFDNAQLTLWLDNYIRENQPRLVEVRNKKHITAGYVIPIKLVAHLADLNTCLDEVEAA